MALNRLQIAAEGLSLSESQTDKKCFIADQSLIESLTLNFFALYRFHNPSDNYN